MDNLKDYPECEGKIGCQYDDCKWRDIVYEERHKLWSGLSSSKFTVSETIGHHVCLKLLANLMKKVKLLNE